MLRQLGPVGKLQDPLVQVGPLSGHQLPGPAATASASPGSPPADPIHNSRPCEGSPAVWAEAQPHPLVSNAAQAPARVGQV
jgi:hypothetical protein